MSVGHRKLCNTNTKNHAPGGKDFFEGTKYSAKVLDQIKDVKDNYHFFPELIKLGQSEGVLSTVKGGDGVIREMLRIPGLVNGTRGHYKFIKEADGTINHRLFVPDP